MWLIFAFISAFTLGCNDAFKKVSLVNNTLLPVVFLNTVFCCLILTPFLLTSRYVPDSLEETLFFVPKVDLPTHLFILFKAGLVLLAWLLIDSAIKHLPLTFVSPIKAAQPMLVIVGAMIFFSEKLNVYQWIGVIFAITSFFLLSTSGKKEGIYLNRNKWVFCLITGVIVNAACGLYDKFLMNQYDRMAVLVWYNIYQCLFMGIAFSVWFFFFKKGSFIWRWQILLVSLFICFTDFTYFYSLSCEGAMISIVSMIRRSGIIVSFLLGVWFFREKNLKGKAAGLVLMLISMVLLFVGSINQGT
ncbi:MAG: DMT family transporter [Dysgonamonadaceae bacterium]|jgi:transporter family protein|nr:DMT family transporter [Dysgonamonadaceae bacterium]